MNFCLKRALPPRDVPGRRHLCRRLVSARAPDPQLDVHQGEQRRQVQVGDWAHRGCVLTVHRFSQSLQLQVTMEIKLAQLGVRPTAIVLVAILRVQAGAVGKLPKVDSTD